MKQVRQFAQYVFLGATIGLGSFAGGVQAQQATTVTQAAPATSGQNTAPSADTIRVEPGQIIARVGDKEITMRDFERAYRALPDDVRQRGPQALYLQVLELLIQQTVIVDKARAAGLAQNPNIANRVREYESRLLHDAYLQQAVRQNLTEEAVRKEYDAYAARAAQTQEAKARHILLETKEDAENIIALMAQGSDFANLAQKYSKGPSAERGGDLGYFPPGRMVKAFDDVVFAMQPNTYTSEPVQTRFGWHVILLEDLRPVAVQPFEEIAGRIRQRMGEVMAQQVIRQEIKSATVERFDPQGNALPAPGANQAPLQNSLEPTTSQ